MGDAVVDELDRRLIELLGRDGRRSFTSLAEELGVSQSTVRGRMAKLQDDDVLNIVGICNALMLGHEVARLLIRVRNLTPQDVADDLAANPDIHHIALISGSYDIYLEVTCRDQEQLIRLLDEIRCTPGVAAIQPIIITSLAKDYTWHGLRGTAGQSVSNPDA
ncbi:MULTISPECIES: Lrp/AsnC family transcriptional regulator [unclassified Leucobacter]|uniref:Lrp/AsnC family transcriptional regulator n=1 Tax=unclassified Leucobacter TaxID=2621730 RepID=UPI001CB6B840|nr:MULTISPECIES: Lrp/AsnC family transcriptional regulator [unclassified Leucobacter]